MSMEVRIQYWTVTNSLEFVTTCPNDVGEINHEECEEQRARDETLHAVLLLPHHSMPILLHVYVLGVA